MKCLFLVAVLGVSGCRCTHTSVTNPEGWTIKRCTHNLLMEDETEVTIKFPSGVEAVIKQKTKPDAHVVDKISEKAGVPK